jgi:hypothetical protein
LHYSKFYWENCVSEEAGLGIFANMVDRLEVEVEVEVEIEIEVEVVVEMDEAAGMDVPSRLIMFTPRENILSRAASCTQAVLRADKLLGE